MAAALTVAVIWGVNVPLMKAALGHVHPFVFNAARLTLSAIALGVVDWIERRGQPAPRSLDARCVAPGVLAVAWVFLGEIPGMVQLAGGALVILGLIDWRARR